MVVTSRGHYIIQKPMATSSRCLSSSLRLPRKSAFVEMLKQCEMSGQGFRRNSLAT